MTNEVAEKIVRGITDKIECNTVDIDDWAEFWGFTREEYEEFLDMAIKALEIELLTDTEQRIFLKAISRERNVCQLVDDTYESYGIDSNVLLVEVCNSIERKVKKIWE